MGPMGRKVQAELVKLITRALGESKVHSEMNEHEVTVSALINRKISVVIRVESLPTHIDIHQHISLSSLSAHEATATAALLIDVGVRVRNAENLVSNYMKTQPGARVSSEFAPVEI